MAESAEIEAGESEGILILNYQFLLPYTILEENPFVFHLALSIFKSEWRIPIAHHSVILRLEAPEHRMHCRN